MFTKEAMIVHNICNFPSGSRSAGGTGRHQISGVGIVNKNTAQRPFWAARRVARKFPAGGRELRRGGFAAPVH